MLHTVELGLFAENHESFFINRDCQQCLSHTITTNTEKKPNGMSSELSDVPQSGGGGGESLSLKKPLSLVGLGCFLVKIRRLIGV